MQYRGFLCFEKYLIRQMIIALKSTIKRSATLPTSRRNPHHEFRKTGAAGRARNALWKIQRKAAGRPARPLPGLVRARGFPLGRTGQPDRAHVRTRPQRFAQPAGPAAHAQVTLAARGIRRRLEFADFLG